MEFSHAFVLAICLYDDKNFAADRLFIPFKVMHIMYVVLIVSLSNVNRLTILTLI